jgi:membrane protease YdiL (CAAX protease family)
MTPQSRHTPLVAAEPETQPRVWTVFLVLAIAPACFGLVTVVFAVVVSGIIFAARGMPHAEASAALNEFVRSTSGKTTSHAIFASLFIGTALLFGKLSKRGVALRLALGPTRATVPELILGSIGGVAASSAIRGAVQWLAIMTHWSADSVNSKSLTQLNTARSPQGIDLTIAIVAVFGVIGPIAEELFFRGYVQTRLRARWGPVASIAITSVAFGLYHLPDLAYALFATFFGAYLGWLAHYAGGTRPAILAHTVNNTSAVILSVIVGRLGLDRAASTGPSSHAIAGPAIVAAACIAAMFVMRAFLARRAEKQPARLTV